MKRSCLSETYLSLNGSIRDISPDGIYLSWEITSVNMEEPITLSLILKREIYET